MITRWNESISKMALPVPFSVCKNSPAPFQKMHFRVRGQFTEPLNWVGPNRHHKGAVERCPFTNSRLQNSIEISRASRVPAVAPYGLKNACLRPIWLLQICLMVVCEGRSLINTDRRTGNLLRAYSFNSKASYCRWKLDRYKLKVDNITWT